MKLTVLGLPLKSKKHCFLYRKLLLHWFKEQLQFATEIFLLESFRKTNLYNVSCCKLKFFLKAK